MKNMPLVGIVIPVYKVRYEYLKQCVESVTLQTYKNLQIILVDDCSPDECGKWCDDFSAIDSRIEVYHHTKNKKLPGARNTGLDHLKCDWVTFLDSDDWLDFDTIEKLMSFILDYENEIDFAFFPLCRNYKNKETDAFFKNFESFEESSMETLQIESLELAKKSDLRHFNMNDSACGKLINVKTLIKSNIRFRDLDYREDGMFYMELCQASKHALAIPVGKYHYRETKGSMVNGFRENAPVEQLNYINALLDFGRANNKNDAFFNAINYYLIISAQTAIIQYFYNIVKKNKLKKECLEYLTNEPFLSGLKNIKSSYLNFHFRIKYFLIKHKMFGLLVRVRGFYSKNKKYEPYD